METPNSIVIKKESNGNILVTDNGRFYTLKVNSKITKQLNSVLVNESFYESAIIEFTVASVLKVIREDGTEIAISDVDTLFSELNTYFFFEEESLSLDNRIVVTQENAATTLGGVIDSTKQYFLDGIIDLGTTQITVPIGGMTIIGLSFDLSGLISSEDNYTMFVSETPLIGSGNLLGADYYISVTGAGSKVYELYDATGFNAFEFTRLNYIDCSSLGDIYDYRQGLELGTGRFGGSPSLTLHGLWRGGYRITTSIVRSLSGTMTAPLFKEGTLFQMNSRFLTDINCDLPTLAPFCDFQVANFPNPSTVQVKGAIFSRDGSFNANDTNIFSNLDRGDLPCDWKNNIGISNTFVGGELQNDTDTTTTITVQNEFEDLAGNWLTDGLEHCDSPSSGVIRHLGINPKEFTVSWSFVMSGKRNDNYEIALLRLNGGVGIPDVLTTQVRVINNLQGGRDVGYWVGKKNIILNQDDQLFFQVANLSDTDNIVLETDSNWFLEER